MAPSLIATPDDWGSLVNQAAMRWRSAAAELRRAQQVSRFDPEHSLEARFQVRSSRMKEAAARAEYEQVLSGLCGELRKNPEDTKLLWLVGKPS